MAGLLVPDEIACSADIQIVAGEMKSGAKTVQIGQHLEAFFRRLRQDATFGRGEIGISARLGASHPAAQLVKLRQTETVGAMDNQRIGAGDVQAAFDNRG